MRPPLARRATMPAWRRTRQSGRSSREARAALPSRSSAGACDASTCACARTAPRTSPSRRASRSPRHSASSTGTPTGSAGTSTGAWRLRPRPRPQTGSSPSGAGSSRCPGAPPPMRSTAPRSPAACPRSPRAWRGPWAHAPPAGSCARCPRAGAPARPGRGGSASTSGLPPIRPPAWTTSLPTSSRTSWSPGHGERFHVLLARAYPDERAVRALLRRPPRDVAATDSFPAGNTHETAAG